MFKNVLLLTFLSLIVNSSKSQTFNWHLAAQAGTANHHFENYQGALMAGFQNSDGQQLSFGPIFKRYNMNSQFKNSMGGRIYSQAKVYNSISLYLQCDVFDGVQSQFHSSGKSPMRLESGAGIIYTFYEKVGLSAGYNLGELNPLTGLRKNTPVIKLIYLMPFTRPW